MRLLHLSLPFILLLTICSLPPWLLMTGVTPGGGCTESRCCHQAFSSPWAFFGDYRRLSDIEFECCNYSGTFQNLNNHSKTSSNTLHPSPYNSNMVKSNLKVLPGIAVVDSQSQLTERSTFWDGNSYEMLKLTSFDHQNIVVLEDDPVVTESAYNLFKTHSSVSTLLKSRIGVLQTIEGPEVHLTRDSRIVLVGHGSRGTDGSSMLGGHTPQEIAKLVDAMKVKGGHIQSLSLVGCNLGGDHRFAKQLLSELRTLHVETKLHLYRSLISVNSTGEVLTSDGTVWRLKDHSKRMSAQLDQQGNLLTWVEQGQRGETIPCYRGRPLHSQNLEWPTHPQMFVPAELRKQHTSIDCLEALTWGLFFKKNERIRASDFIPSDGRAPIWLNDSKPEDDAPIKHIASILDLIVEIRHNAREDENADLHYVLNNYIYRVQKTTLQSSLVGKYMKPSDEQEIQRFMNSTINSTALGTLAELRRSLSASQFNEFCRQTFQMQKCEQDCDRWGLFLMDGVFSASVRNFHTFSLFLMSVIACEVSRLKGVDDSICTAFVGDSYPMPAEDPWPNSSRRGFYGCSSNEAITKQETADWLKEVVSKENDLYTRTRQLMSGVDHDMQTELDIFGKVKVMNEDAFSEFVKYFHGTAEGKRLTRGCVDPPTYRPNE